MALQSLYLVVYILTVMSSKATDGRIVDLTHILDENATKFPSVIHRYYKYSYAHNGKIGTSPNVFWLAYGMLEVFEHYGTHIDAPNHFSEGGQAVHEIPPHMLMGPGVVIDVKDKAAKNWDYGVTPEDILDHEAKFGRIPSGAIVIMNSGWGLRFPNPELVWGSKQINDSSTFHFPGFTLEACQFLLTKRNVINLGVDSACTDYGPNCKWERQFPCHVLMLGNSIPLLEYVANLDSIPQRGTTIFIGAPKHRGGTGGQSRLLAVLPDDDDKQKMYSACRTCHCLPGAVILLATLSQITKAL